MTVIDGVITVLMCLLIIGIALFGAWLISRDMP